MPSRKKLSDEHKTYIVRRLATNDSLIVIARGLKQEFGVTVPIDLIRNYNPERTAGRRMARRWKGLFWKTRKAFVEAIADVAAKHPLIRIYWRGEMTQEAWAASEHRIANELLDSIAKEPGATPAASTGQGHFGLTDGPLTATVNIVHRHEPAPAPEPTPKERKSDD
jgi:hypothetical protein